LKRFRELRGYTQSALADLCDLHKSYVSNVERGTVNISLANLEALAAGLGCAEYELLQKRAETGFIAQALTQKGTRPELTSRPGFASTAHAAYQEPAEPPTDYLLVLQ
jgi:transcriptional regulator with XRE-family HTH domain